MREPDLEWQSDCNKLVLVFPSYDMVYELATTREKAEASSKALCQLLGQVGSYQLDDMREVLKGYDVNTDDLTINDMIKLIILQAASDLHDKENMEELCEWQNDFLAESRRN
jgi:hypothetical protein